MDLEGDPSTSIMDGKAMTAVVVRFRSTPTVDMEQKKSLVKTRA